MRNQTEPAQMTRLLFQKPAAYAELEENARIAISVLQDDGWSIERIGLDMRVQVTATPLIERGDGEVARIAATVEEAERKFASLRIALITAAGDQWTAAAFAFFASAFLIWLGAGKWCGVFGAICVGAKVWHHHHFSKGTK